MIFPSTFVKIRTLIFRKTILKTIFYNELLILFLLVLILVTKESIFNFFLKKRVMSKAYLYLIKYQ